MNLLEVTHLTEDQAREYIESIRWPNGPTCPHCTSQEVTKLQGRATRPGVYKCKACRKQFTVTVGTIMHRSHASLKTWVIAFHLMSSSKKGMSAHQLHREFGVAYQTAWHMAHRIRHAMKKEPLASMLKGTVEVDETYVGARRVRGKRGRGAGRKTPVVALVERGGGMHAKPVANVTAKNLKNAIREVIHPDARIITDDLSSYHGIGSEFPGGHNVIRHSLGKYVEGDVYTNTVESFFALLKRGVHGTFHHVSKKHLHRYCDEFSFRWNHRKVDDGMRTEAAIRAAEGKRLTYKPITGSESA